MQVLTDQPDYQKSRKYWNKLSERLRKEGSESVSNCHRLKLEAADGKKYLTDVGLIEKPLGLEEKTSKSVISNQNFLPKDQKKKLKDENE